MTRDLEGAFRAALAGEVRFDGYTRHLYSTDASLYAIEPLGVAYPRDADDVAAAIEVAGRFGVAAFAGAGTVAPTMAKLSSGTVLPSFGGGARWLLLPKQGTTVRVDYGVGKGSSGLYIAFNEAF